MIRAVERAAVAWGRQIARYSLSVVRPEQTVVSGGQRISLRPGIWVSWHRNNLLALAFFQQQFKRPCITFVPPGLEGATMQGWIQGIGITPVRLPKDNAGNPQAALKQMARALREGTDVVIALDGPHGPAERARSGALWLARLTGSPLMPAGFAASWSVSYPRWDRHLIPLPGSWVSAVIGEPMTIGRDEPIDEALRAAVAERVQAANHLARHLLVGMAGKRGPGPSLAGQASDSPQERL